MQKNVASQKFVVFAFDRTDNTPKTGDAAQITANIRKDHAAAAATNDVNPTETEGGFYTFDATQSETNADTIQIFPASSTADIQVICVPGIIYTLPETFADDVIQTGDTFARVGAPAGASISADLADVPTVAEFDARTLVAASYFDPAADAVANVTLTATTTDVTNQVTADVTGISGDSTAADNLEAMYDGTGYTDDNAPATQSQLGGISTGAVASSISPSTYTLNSGSLTSGLVGDVDSLGTAHVHASAAGVLDIEYHHLIGAGTPSSVTLDVFLQNNNDDVEVNGYDWVSASYKKIGEINGKNAATYESLTFPLNNNMVGTGSDLGKVDIQMTDGAFTLTSAVFSLDRLYVSYNQTTGGYINGIEVDTTGLTNTNTIFGVDGIIGNPVSTWAAALTLAAKANIYTFNLGNGSTITLTANSDNYTITGDNYTIALGGQSIANIYIEGAISISGVSSGTNAKIVDCLFGSTISLDSGWFKNCRINGTITLLGAGGYFFQSCFATTGTIPIIDLDAAVGSQTVCLTPLTGGVQFNNMKADDLVHCEGFGEVTLDTTCTAGTFEYSGDWRLTDNSATVALAPGDNTANIASILTDTEVIGAAGAGLTDLGGMSTGMKAEINAEADTALTDYDPATNAEMEARTPTAAQLAYIVANSATGLPVTFTTSGGSTTVAVIALVDGSAGSATDDQYNGRLLVFTDGTLKGVVTDITDYVGSTTTATITAIPTAPTASHNARLI